MVRKTRIFGCDYDLGCFLFIDNGKRKEKKKEKEAKTESNQKIKLKIPEIRDINYNLELWVKKNNIMRFILILLRFCLRTQIFLKIQWITGFQLLNKCIFFLKKLLFVPILKKTIVFTSMNPKKIVCLFLEYVIWPKVNT